MCWRAEILHEWAFQCFQSFLLFKISRSSLWIFLKKKLLIRNMWKVYTRPTSASGFFKSVNFLKLMVFLVEIMFLIWKCTNKTASSEFWNFELPHNFWFSKLKVCNMRKYFCIISGILGVFRFSFSFLYFPHRNIYFFTDLDIWIDVQFQIIISARKFLKPTLWTTMDRPSYTRSFAKTKDTQLGKKNLKSVVKSMSKL
jgi:hypothetical protein